MKRTPFVVFVILLAVFIIFFPAIFHQTAAQGVEQGTEVDETIIVPDQSKPFVLMLVQLFFYTALVIVLIVLFARFLAKRRQWWGEHALFQNLGGAPLGANKSVQLVKLGDKIYVLGVGEEITLLDIIDDPDEVRRLESEKVNGGERLITSFKGRWPMKQDENQQVKGELKEEINFEAVLEKSLLEQKKKRQWQISRLSMEERQNEHGEDR